MDRIRYRLERDLSGERGHITTLEASAHANLPYRGSRRR